MSGRGTAVRRPPTPEAQVTHVAPHRLRDQVVMHTFLHPVLPKGWKISRKLGLGLLGFGLLIPSRAWAHGVEASFRAIPTFQIEARYDSGEPMGSAQVTVFAPTDPTTPWQEGQTDTRGQFLLQPDPNLTGLWQVRIRQAGHGVLLNVPVGEDAAVAGGIHGSSPPFGPLQRGVMAACVIWGCLSTALFFSTPRPEPKTLRPTFTASALEQD